MLVLLRWVLYAICVVSAAVLLTWLGIQAVFVYPDMARGRFLLTFWPWEGLALLCMVGALVLPPRRTV